MKQKHTILYDTTLRDGAQGVGIAYSVEDKLRILARLDALGLPYVEGGYPGASPKEAEFFARVAAGELKLANTQLVAFGTTRRAGVEATADTGLATLLDADTEVVCLVAKAWDHHVRETLRTTLEENLAMLRDSVRLCKEAGRMAPRKVIVDLEHYFDGYAVNPDYAREMLVAACEAGADTVVLCDTNGGTLPACVSSVVKEAGECVHSYENHCQNRDEVRNLLLGVHFHNDTGCAVANSLLAVEAGADQVQGTVNGYGERAGNADLLVVAASLVTKMGDSCLSNEQLAQLTEVSRFVADVANMSLDQHHPYTGKAAFSYKAGLHASALDRLDKAYEHIEPEAVGNLARVVVSDLAGRASLKLKATALGREVSDEDAIAVLARIKELEQAGYSFEAADASLALLIDKEQGSYRPLFRLESFRVEADKREDGRVTTEATIKLHVGDERFVAIGEGNGPVNALDIALRNALTPFYPELAGISLLDYKVRVLDESSGTDAVTRVLITSGDERQTWGTVGVSPNIIEASWEALVASLEYGLTNRDSGAF